MILGLDPIYWICLGFAGMLAFVTVMFLKMVETIHILKEIRDGQKIVPVSQSSGPLVTITTTDPLLSAFGQSRQQPMQPLSTTKPDTEPIGSMDTTITMPRVKP